MKGKEQQIRLAIEMLEAEFPKLLKKKTRVIERIRKTEDTQHKYISRNDQLDKRLVAYRDTVDEMHDFLEDAKGRISDLIKEE